MVYKFTVTEDKFTKDKFKNCELMKKLLYYYLIVSKDKFKFINYFINLLFIVSKYKLKTMN